MSDNYDKIRSLLGEIEEHLRRNAPVENSSSSVSSDKLQLRTSIENLKQAINVQQQQQEDLRRRENEIIEVLMKFLTMDFSVKAPISPEHDELDAIACGINTMVEELHYHIRKAQDAEYLSRVMIEGVKEYAIIMLDPSGNITSWNSGAEKIKGYSSLEILGKHFSIFYPETEQLNALFVIEQARKNGTVIHEGWRIKKDGSMFWADVSLTAIFDANGILSGFCKVTRDVTQKRNDALLLEEKRIKLEESLSALALTTEELRRSNRDLEQFAYVASHDLQEPLRMVTSYVQLLERRYKDKLGEEATEFISYAVEGAARMRNLIESLLEYSRVNREIRLEVVNINDVMKAVTGNLNRMIAETKAQIHWDNLPEAAGDATFVGQLLQNLIVNAIKFKSEAAPLISVTARELGDEIEYSVNDNGIGIKEEYLEKIFVLFQRLHGKNKYPGTGIGLAICKRIAERHGGSIRAASEFGKGSSFIFTLKAKKAASKE